MEKVNDTLEITNVIKPKPNSLVASLQSNISFHDKLKNCSRNVIT